MRLLVRAALYPVRTRVRRRVSLAVVVLAVAWFALWPGADRPPPGRVVLEAFTPKSPDEAPSEEELELARRFEEARRAAFDARRRAGFVHEAPYTDAGAALPPGIPDDALYEVVYDPPGARRTGIAQTVWLPQESYPEVYRLREELAALRARPSSAP